MNTQHPSARVATTRAALRLVEPAPEPVKADGLLLLTVPAYGLHAGDIVARTGVWCTVAHTDHLTGEHGPVIHALLDTLDGRGREMRIVADEPVAVLRRPAGGDCADTEEPAATSNADAAGWNDAIPGGAA